MQKAVVLSILGTIFMLTGNDAAEKMLCASTHIAQNLKLHYINFSAGLLLRRYYNEKEDSLKLMKQTRLNTLYMQKATCLLNERIEL